MRRLFHDKNIDTLVWGAMILFVIMIVLFNCDSNKCKSHADCPSEHGCVQEQCIPWQCKTNDDCDNKIRVCDSSTHTCRKCVEHKDCSAGLYCLNGTCDANNPTCTNNGFLEVCKSCTQSDDCPADLTCEKYSSTSTKMICKR